MSLRIVIADDHPLFRAALRHALVQISAEAAIHEAESLISAIELVKSLDDVDLILLDLGLPDSADYEGLLRFRNEFPSVGVAVVSGKEEPSIIRQVAALGAIAFVPKSSTVDVLIEAISTALRGQAWFPEADSQEPKREVNEALVQKIASLSPQQYRVLCMVADGKLNKQIAAELNIQESTIKQHVSAVLRKLGLINRTQAGVLLKSFLQSPQT